MHFSLAENRLVFRDSMDNIDKKTLFQSPEEIDSQTRNALHDLQEQVYYEQEKEYEDHFWDSDEAPVPIRFSSEEDFQELKQWVQHERDRQELEELQPVFYDKDIERHPDGSITVNALLNGNTFREYKERFAYRTYSREQLRKEIARMHLERKAQQELYERANDIVGRLEDLLSELQKTFYKGYIGYTKEEQGNRRKWRKEQKRRVKVSQMLHSVYERVTEDIASKPTIRVRTEGYDVPHTADLLWISSSPAPPDRAYGFSSRENQISMTKEERRVLQDRYVPLMYEQFIHQMDEIYKNNNGKKPETIADYTLKLLEEERPLSEGDIWEYERNRTAIADLIQNVADDRERFGDIRDKAKNESETLLTTIGRYEERIQSMPAD